MSKTKTAPAPAASSAEIEAVAYVDLEAAAEAEAQVGAPTETARFQAAKTQWLTTAASEGFGPAGHILDLTEAEVAAAPAGLLVAPTTEQLAQRL